MNGWLAEACEKLARATGEDASVYGLSEDDVDELLELARVAAHESGDRRNAPLVCYLAGLARGRHAADLADLVDEVVGKRL